MAGQPVLSDKPRLAEIQRYIRDAGVSRGYDTSTQYCLMLLCEEVGELAKAIRKTTGGTIDPESRDAHVDEEAADVLWMLLCICNSQGVNLEQAFRKKEEKNKLRVWK